MKRKLLAMVFAVLVILPIGWMIAMMLTPVLWRLEPVLHLELAGHSGPSGWVFAVIWALLAIVVLLLLRWTLPRK